MDSAEPVGESFRPRESVQWRDVRGKLVAIDMTSGDYHVFNDVGGLIWRGIVAGRRRDAILDEIIAAYKVTRARAVEDFEAFVESLKSRGLLQ